MLKSVDTQTGICDSASIVITSFRKMFMYKWRCTIRGIDVDSGRFEDSWASISILTLRVLSLHSGRPDW